MKFLKKTVIATIIFAASNAQALEVNHDIKVNLGALDACKTSFSYTIEKQKYSVKSTIKTDGAFDAIYPFEGEYISEGKISQDKLNSTCYKYETQSRFDNKTKELVYDQKGYPVYSINSKNKKKKTKSIFQDPKNQDTTDLQSVFAKMAKQYNKLRFCDSRMKVFDGKRRFDIIFKDEGQETLVKSELSPYEGKARKCLMYVDKLEEKEDELLWQITKEKPVYFWILEDNKKTPFIAKIAVENTPLGRLEAYTTKVTIR